MDAEYYLNPYGTSFHIEYSQMPLKFNMKQNHYHDFYEVYFYLGNEMSFFIEDKTYRVKKFDMLFIDRFTYHRTLYRDKDSRERLLMIIQPDVLDFLNNTPIKARLLELFKVKKVSFPSHVSQALARTMLDTILPTYSDSNSPTAYARSVFQALNLLMEILDMYENGTLATDEAELQVQDKKVSEIVRYINANYPNKITLDSISRELFINKYYLCHIFKKVTGTGIVNFINNKRLAEAEKLLRYSNSNITEISETVGFSNITRFICLFKNKYGCTPGKFKEESSVPKY